MSDSIRKRALLIGTQTYEDPRFAPLPCAKADTAQLSQVLRHPAIGAFDSIAVVSDPTARSMREEIGGFLESLGADELGLLYISGHGVRLSHSTGEFHFIASDTEFTAVERTGVGATFVNELLEHCRAPQKVAILDCCQSGGFSLGFRTRDTKSAWTSDPPFRSRGVYIISSSGPDEASYAGGTSVSGQQPSAFTEELVEALRTGRGDTDSDGIVSVDELFNYVNRRMRKRALGRLQIPVISSDKVNTRIHLARSYTGPPIPPLTLPDPHQAISSPPATLRDRNPFELWPVLLDYYRRCIEASDSAMPLMSVDELHERYECLAGVERLLSGDLDETGTVPLPQTAIDLVERADREEAEIWYGYPAVVLTTAPDGTPYPNERLAPLIIRPVEVISDVEGLRLRPRGQPSLHRQLVVERLDDQLAERMVSEYRPSWRGGMHSQLVQEVRALLSDLTLSDAQLLDPEDLQSEIDLRTPQQGARNAALLFLASRATQANTGLLKDLRAIEDSREDIGRTALGVLFDAGAARQQPGSQQPGSQRPGSQRHVAPLPLNEGQQAVLASAMSQRITVATGPPGTGKTQLVANLVATAVSSGQTVLVASTNNPAVDEVWERCDRLVAGSLIRTGSTTGGRNSRDDERATLQKLLAVAPSGNATSARARLEQALTSLDRVVTGMAAKAMLEQELAQIAEAREVAAGRLASTTKDLASHFRHVRLDDLSRRARRAAGARLLGRWRRSRFLRRVRWSAEPTPDVCSMIDDWVQVEQRWRAKRDVMLRLPEDDAERDALQARQLEMRERSREVLECVVSTSAAAGRRQIRSLLEATASSRPDWSERAAALRYVPGWAVTNLSLRRFPARPALFDLVIVDEASQCSIPQVLPALFRARRALIIGDPMQLSPVITLKPAQEAQIRHEIGISASLLEEHRITYHRHSAFHALEGCAGEALLLDEHFRCHPAIAAVSNEQFYDGRLTVLTDVARLPRAGGDALRWIHVPGDECRRHSASWVNDAEAEQVHQVVDWLLEHLPPAASVGVVTPFSAQAAMMRRRWRGNDRVQVATVHRFQGAERAAMVLSLVAGPGTRSTTARRWLSRERRLWNVAITRARSHLVVVGDQDVWHKDVGIGRALLDAAGTVPPSPSSVASVVDPLLMQLHQLLDASLSDVELLEMWDGYPVDAAVLDGTATTAILIDRGHGDMPPARHLRLQYARQCLLTDAERARRAVRVPAWRLFDETFSVVDLVAIP